MPSWDRKSHPPMASALPGAASKSAAIRRGKLEISDPIPMPEEHLDESDARIDDGRGRYHFTTSLPKLDAWPGRSTTSATQDLSPRKGHIDSTSVPSNSHGSTDRTSAAMTNTHLSMSSVPSDGLMRKSNGIKATFRRMLGSKRRRNTLTAVANDHRNSSGNLFDHARSTNNHSLRKPSLLFEELIRDRALKSHAPSVVPSESVQAHDKRAETTNGPVGGFNRVNSFPSVVLPSKGAQSLDLKFNTRETGSESRIYPKLRRMPHRSLIDSVKRKSRSADALRDMALSQNTLQAQERRLSDEIKYWRNSIIEDPLPSLTSSGHEVTDNVKASPSNSSPTPTSQTPPARLPVEHVSPRPQDFDFSDLVIGSGEASVEQRITTVEVKLIDLECAIANLQNYEVAKRVLLGKPPRRRKALQTLSQQAAARSCSTPGFYPKSSFDSSSNESSTSKDRLEQSGERRDSVANTLRPGTAAQSDASTAVAPRPPLPAKGDTEDEIARLMSMLTHEQEARRVLENQLKDLQKQMNELRFPTATRCSPAPGHLSTPTSHDSDFSPISAKRPTVLPFRMASPRWASGQRRSSWKENEGEETDTDDGFLDVYETPMEARENGFGVDMSRSPPLVGVM